MSKKTVTLVAAMAENRVMGRSNSLPWRAKGDFKFFKNYTINKPLIMGRKTFDSLKQFGVQPLPDRPNLIITRDKNYKFEHDDVSIYHTIEDALAHAESFDVDEICIGGGAMIYEMALPFADKILLTEIHTIIADGDTFFPDFSTKDWKETNRTPCKAEKGDTADYTFTTWIKK